LPNLGVGAARDVDGVGHQRRVAAHQRDAGRMHGHVGAGGHGNAHIRGGQRRRVVDAVAHHCHASAALIKLILEPCHDGGLVFGQDLGMHDVNAELPGNRFGAAAVVAGQHGGLDAQRVQPGNGRARAGFERVAKGQQPQQLRCAAHIGQPRHGAATAFQFPGACRKGGQIHAKLLHEARASQPQFATVHLRRHAAPGDRAHLRRRGHADLVLDGQRRDGFGQWMFAAGLNRCAPGQNGVARETRGWLQCHQFRLALRQRAGLVEGHNFHLVRHFQRLGVLDQDAVPGAGAGADHDGCGGCQPHGARAGNHQHGDGIQNGRLPVAGAKAPGQHGDEGDDDDDRYKNGADLIDHALNRRFFRLRRLHHANNAGQH